MLFGPGPSSPPLNLSLVAVSYHGDARSVAERAELCTVLEGGQRHRLENMFSAIGRHEGFSKVTDGERFRLWKGKHSHGRD